MAAITFKGNPVTLSGNPVETGKPAPEAALKGAGLKDVKISDFKGGVTIVSVVPSLDTPVCDMQTRKFNEEATSLSGVKVVTVSMDLPFAQARWCGAADVKNVETISDYKDRQFGENWGLYIQELGLLARAVYVLDADGVVKYAEVVPEVTHEPDYAAALAAAKELA